MASTRTAASSTTPYRDATGATLADYPRPSVAVDTAVLTLAPRNRPSRGAPPHQLSVLLVRLPEEVAGLQWALPGTFLHEGERLADAVTRSLTEKAGIVSRQRRGVTGRGPAQLQVFDGPDRDPRGWVLSVAHLAVIPYNSLAGAVLADPEQVRLTPVSKREPLPYGHSEIVTKAKKELRQRYNARPDPLHLLGTEFTMRELLDVHQAITGHTLQKDTFRRAMEPRLVGTGRLSSGTVGRPSQRFRRAPASGS